VLPTILTCHSLELKLCVTFVTEVSLLEGSRTSDLRELSKFRDFTENRSVLFPSVLATIAEASCRRGKQLDFQSRKSIFIVCISNPSPGSVLFNRSNLLKRKDLLRVTIEPARPHLDVHFIASSLSASLFTVSQV
jgi:hypothetical protein